MLLAITAAARAADILAAGPLFFDDRQDNVACTVLNAGPFAVSVISTEILTTDDRPPYVLDRTCVGLLAPGKACVAFASIDTSGSLSCRMRVSPSKVHLRGTFSLLGPGFEFRVLSQAELR